MNSLRVVSAKAGLRVIAVVGVVALVCGVSGRAASAAPSEKSDEKIPLAISLGDSFISGEGGRFAGNIYDSRESDEAQDEGPHNKGRLVYQDSWGSYEFSEGKNADRETVDSSVSCHRSDSAEIQATRAAFGWTPVNLACSGAKSRDVTVDWYHEEEAQVKQLAKLAKDPRYDIKAVVLSIGGNDLGFSDLMGKLVQVSSTNSPTDQTLGNWINPFATKKTLWQEYAQNIPDIEDKIANTLNSITNTMRAAGYRDGTYRFVYQSYSNLFAGSHHRYMAVDSKWQLGRQESPGVPLSNATVDYSRSHMVPALTQMTKAGLAKANNKFIQFMDLTNAFNGHELSSRDTEQILIKQKKVPEAATAEWVVPINSNFVAGAIVKSSRHFESFHPNRFGQEAYGTCLVAAIKSNHRELVCVGQPDKPPTELEITTKGGLLPGGLNLKQPAFHELINYYLPKKAVLDFH